MIIDNRARVSGVGLWFRCGFIELLLGKTGLYPRRQRHSWFFGGGGGVAWPLFKAQV